MALGRCLNSSILPVRDGTHSSPARERERERFNHKDLLPPGFEVTTLPSALFPLDSKRNRVTKNKSGMPRGVQNEERIKLLEQWEAATCRDGAVFAFASAHCKIVPGIRALRGFGSNHQAHFL